MRLPGERVRTLLGSDFQHPVVDRWLRRFARPELIAAGPLLGLALLLGATGAGNYVERHLLRTPLQKALATLERGPRLHPDVRLVVADDRVLKRLGRAPRFDEWQAVAALLEKIGYETILLVGFHDLEGEIGPTVARSPERRAKLYVGAVTVANERNLRATPAASLPDRLFAAGASHELGTKVASGEFLLTGERAVLDAVDGLGSLDLDADSTFPFVVEAGGRLLPQLALWTAGPLAAAEGGLRARESVLPRSADGRLHVDYVRWSDALQSAVPITAFFDEGLARVEGFTAMLLERVRGGRVALLVPDAHTGARFVDAPEGKVPAYLATVSVASGLLSGRFVLSPVRPLGPMLGLTALALVLVSIRRARVALAGLGALTFAALTATVAAWIARGWILPGAGMALVGVLAFSWRLVWHLGIVLRDRLNLRHDLEMGRLVQDLVLPEAKTGRFAGWEFKVVYRPYGAMSGDWFMTYQTPPGAPVPFMVAAIGDVVGKGPSAALITSAIGSVWNAYAPTWHDGFDMRVFLEALHGAVRHTFRGVQNSTLTLFVLDETGAHVVNLGAPPPLVVEPRTRRVERVRTKPADPLGIGAGTTKVRAVSVALAEGAYLAAYTDGVIDGGAARGRLSSLVAGGALREEPAFEDIEGLFARANAGEALPDDFTLLLVRRAEPVALRSLAEEGQIVAV